LATTCFLPRAREKIAIVAGALRMDRRSACGGAAAAGGTVAL